MSKKITRRTFIKGAAVAGGALAGAPVLNSSNLFSANAAESVKRGGTWRIAWNRAVQSLDGHRVSNQWACTGGMYDCLVESSVDSKTRKIKLGPGLATGWRYENNNKRVIFELRKGIRFHDNNKFDATVAKWNLDRMRLDPKSYLKKDVQEIESVEMLGDYTIALNLKYPSQGLLYNLASGRLTGAIISKAFQEKHGDDELARKGCGTGPFRYKNWIVDEKVILERNPDYWKNGLDGKPLPYIDGLEDHLRKDLTKAAMDMRTGGLDTVYLLLERDVKMVRDHADLEYLELPPFEFQPGCIGFNSRRGPFTSHTLRQAACYAIDRKKILRIIGHGIGRVHRYPWIAPGQIGWDPNRWPDYSYNPDKARELAKVDYPKGVTIKLYSIHREPDNSVAVLLKSMWDAAGIKTEIKAIERLAWIETMRKDTYETGFWNATTTLGAFIRDRLVSGGKSNWGQHKNPKVDQMLEEHIKTVDRAKRHELMAEILRTVYEAAEITGIYARPLPVGTRKNVKGIRTAFKHLIAGEIWKV